VPCRRKSDKKQTKSFPPSSVGLLQNPVKHSPSSLALSRLARALDFGRWDQPRSTANAASQPGRNPCPSDRRSIAQDHDALPVSVRFTTFFFMRPLHFAFSHPKLRWAYVNSWLLYTPDQMLQTLFHIKESSIFRPDIRSICCTAAAQPAPDPSCWERTDPGAPVPPLWWWWKIPGQIAEIKIYARYFLSLDEATTRLKRKMSRKIERETQPSFVGSAKSNSANSAGLRISGCDSEGSGRLSARQTWALLFARRVWHGIKLAAWTSVPSRLQGERKKKLCTCSLAQLLPHRQGRGLILFSGKADNIPMHRFLSRKASAAWTETRHSLGPRRSSLGVTNGGGACSSPWM